MSEPEQSALDEPEVMTDVLGPIPPAQTTVVEDFDERIARAWRPALVINDEGHHIHDEDSEWSKVIRRLHDESSSWPCRPARLLSHASLPEGRPLHLDGLRLPAQAGDHRRRRQAPMKGITAGLEEARPTSPASSTRAT